MTQTMQTDAGSDGDGSSQSLLHIEITGRLIKHVTTERYERHEGDLNNQPGNYRTTSHTLLQTPTVKLTGKKKKEVMKSIEVK